ncbi:hypothetical protein B0A52_07605 [Exophiala mesophila]|uniref:HhH-GPD domain-containing protein n=1 Tax=Exophiala mesophila TaxID=212818 RepID=A0A438MYC9_EXOME|nr:hypothetical protein B0A52_07605 [Exophiala mesophila]
MSKTARTASAATRRVTRSSTSAIQKQTPEPSPKKDETEDTPIKQELISPMKPKTSATKRAATTDNKDIKVKKRIKTDPDSGLASPPLSEINSSLPLSSPEKSRPNSKKGTNKSESKATDLQSKKLKTFAQYSNKSPFPDFPHPTAQDCKLAHRILASLHGKRTRPKEVVASTTRAGCGDSPSVLDALVRTILSQNTSDTNSTRAKQSMDKVYGASDKWDAIVEGGESKLQQAIKCGGLSVVKSRVIISILKQTYEKYGEYSLDHLHQASSEDAMREMISFQGVGPKTASCVLLFCLQRESFAVDTHVWRITGLLGWRPKSASRDETHAHLDVMIPDEDKYGLHILLVTHGKRCDECRAGGKTLGKCELRKAFRKGKLEGEAGEDVKEEEKENVKEEGGEDD